MNRLQELEDRLDFLTFRMPNPDPEEIYKVVREIREIKGEEPDYAAEERLKEKMLQTFKKVRRRRIRNITIAASLVLIITIAFPASLIATREKDFFDIEITKDGINYMVNGSRDDNAQTYKSYDELTNQVKEEIIVPSYVPDNMTLKEITDDDTDLTIYYAAGRKKLTMLITFKELDPYTDHTQVNDLDVTIWETAPGQHSARFKYGRYWYDVRGNVALDEIIKVVEGLEPIQ